MLDFLVIATRSGKRGIIEIYPKFIIKKSSDLMIRGGDFYAIWIEERGLWSTDEQDAVDLIDRELDRYAEENCKRFDDNYRVMHMWDAETGMIDTWHKYCQKQMKDQFHMLDEKLIFSNSKTGKKDYASKMLNYPLEQGEANSYDKLMSVLYSPAERHKIEWAIGSVVSGDSKRLQKFMVLYGAAVLVSPRCSTSFSSSLMVITLYSMLRLSDLRAMHLRWRRSRRTRWLPFNMMVTYPVLRIIRDLTALFRMS